MIYRYRVSVFFLVLALMAAGCSPSKAPLQSSMHTEAIHHKWKITLIKDYEKPLPYAYLDVRDVSHSHAAIGCDTLLFTPKFGYRQRINLDNLQYSSLAVCNENESLKEILFRAFTDVAYFDVGKTALALKNKNGITIVSALLDTGDENGSVNRKWKIVSLINANSDSLAVNHAYIDLKTAGMGTAFLGCNQIHFTVATSGTYEMAIASVASTKKYCRSIAITEDILQKALPLVKKYQVIGNRLKLFDKDDVLLLEGLADL